MTLDEAIKHAKEKAQKHRQTEKKYREIHRSENDESLFKEQLEDCIGCAEEHEQLAQWLEELKEYRQKKEQSSPYNLPCKVGKFVYLIDNRFASSRGKAMKCYIDEFTVSKFGCFAILSGCEPFYMLNRFTSVNIRNFGKTVFLTKEEAEQELKRMECAE